MASASFKSGDPVRPRREKKTAKPVKGGVSPETVVARLYNEHPVDMARLAE